MDKSLSLLISQMPDLDPWDDAGLSECLTYIKRSSKLKIPLEFQESVGSYLECF